jgi:medium-chain acyl-[acyl-carrier-protein] hydrolase
MSQLGPPDTKWVPWTKVGLSPYFRLFCFPYAGGGTWIFARWHTQLPPEIQIAPVVLPGRENRFDEPFPETVGQLVDAWFADVGATLSEVPYVIFGHSFGAVIGFELARHAPWRGFPPPRLVILSGCRPPGLPRTWSPIHHLSQQDFQTTVERRFGSLPPQLRRDPRALESYLRVLRADLRLVETYEFQDGLPLPCPALICGGRADPFVPVADLFHWVRLAAARIVLELFPGGHFFIREHQKLFLEVLRGHLSRLISEVRGN